MTSKPVAQLLADLGVARSHSRPKVSNDNPYSEAQFKTLKYCPAFPDRFGSIADARAFCDRVLQLLQPRTPPLRHRPAHPRLGPLRHRRRDPGATAPTSSPPHTPATPHRFRRPPQPPSCPPRPGSTDPRWNQSDTEQLTRSCLIDLDRFRPGARPTQDRGTRIAHHNTALPAPRPPVDRCRRNGAERPPVGPSVPKWSPDPCIVGRRGMTMAHMGRPLTWAFALSAAGCAGREGGIRTHDPLTPKQPGVLVHQDIEADHHKRCPAVRLRAVLSAAIVTHLVTQHPDKPQGDDGPLWWPCPWMMIYLARIDDRQLPYYGAAVGRRARRSNRPATYRWTSATAPCLRPQQARACPGHGRTVRPGGRPWCLGSPGRTSCPRARPARQAGTASGRR